jgi:protein subunit release factor B
MKPLRVTSVAADALARRMILLGIRETDLEETFIGSGGPGGQNLNKTSTCVVLLHRPTGIQVKCQSTRYQGRNRQAARIVLCDKIEAARRRQADAARTRLEKARRQRRRPSRGARERMLADKSHQAAKKQARRPASWD